MARNQPAAVAMTDPTRELTDAELAGESNAFRNALEGLDIDEGDRVALSLPKAPDS